jgi:hypothetical protein
MKLQYKAAGLMIFLGIITLFTITIIYSYLIKQAVIQEELTNIENLTEEIAHHMDTHLEAFTSFTLMAKQLTH